MRTASPKTYADSAYTMTKEDSTSSLVNSKVIMTQRSKLPKAKQIGQGNITVSSRKVQFNNAKSGQSKMNKTKSAKQLVPSKSGELLTMQKQPLELNFQQRRNLMKVQKLQNKPELSISNVDVKLDFMLNRMNSDSNAVGQLNAFYQNTPNKPVNSSVQSNLSFFNEGHNKSEMMNNYASSNTHDEEICNTLRLATNQF